MLTSLRRLSPGVLPILGASTLLLLSDLGSRIRAEGRESTPAVAVGPQYGSTHVYLAPADVAPFAASFLATFGGKSTKPAVATVTPTPSRTISELILTPVGLLSVFGYETPIPYPFGQERTGYLVSDLDLAIGAARATGAEVLVAPFPDPIGRDAIVAWPGGVTTQLYWHTLAPSYPPLATIPENRVYVSPDRAVAFVQSFLAFARGRIGADEARAPGSEIGRPLETCHRIRLESAFGKWTVFISDGHLPYPYGRELTGYEVADLAATLAKARSAGADILAGPYSAGDRQAAMVRFPGGYIAEIHAPTR
jgi:predicted enzyme related to lactoylglutathione lyase